MKYVYCSASDSSVGCTEEILAAADLRVYLPLRGFADSLNLSVAAALVMHELFRLCPEAIGAMDEAERASLREDWFSRLSAQRIRTPYEARAAKERKRALTKVRHKLNRNTPRTPEVEARMEALRAEEARLKEEEEDATARALGAFFAFDTFFTHPVVSTFDRVPFRLTDE